MDSAPALVLLLMLLLSLSDSDQLLEQSALEATTVRDQTKLKIKFYSNLIKSKNKIKINASIIYCNSECLVQV